MGNNKISKHDNLKRVGLFNPHQEKVNDPLFLEYPHFFDPCDNLQVRYEMLRAHLMGKESVARICRRFSISRQSFYTLQEKFEQEGTAGLLPKKPGPRRPSKLTEEVLEFIQQCLHAGGKVSKEYMKDQIQEKFGVSLHKRTLEKICKELALKKNPCK